METAPEKIRLFRHVERGFYEEAGSVHIENLRKELGLTLEQIAQAVGRNKNSHPRAIRRRLIQIVTLLTLLLELIDDPREAQIWLDAPHSDFAGMAPKQLIVEGNAQALVDYLNEISAGALR